MVSKAKLFRKPTVAKISRGKEPFQVRGNLIEASFQVDPETQFLVIDGNIIPEPFFYVRKDMQGPQITRTAASRKFTKHGPEVRFPAYRNTAQAVAVMKEGRRVPVDIRQAQYDAAKPDTYCCWAFTPIVGKDKRRRRVPLIEVLEGARLYAYSSKLREPISVEPYADAKRVAINGGTVVVTVPSRTPKQDRYEFRIQGIPLFDNDQKYVLASRVVSDHRCPDVTFRIRHTWADDIEDSEVFNWDAHSIAGFYATLDHYCDQHNYIPLAMSQIPLPAQRLAEVYDFFRNHAVILTREKPTQRNPKLYPLNNAELEIVVNQAVQELGHSQTLYSHKSIDKDLRDYKWEGM